VTALQRRLESEYVCDRGGNELVALALQGGQVCERCSRDKIIGQRHANSPVVGLHASHLPEFKCPGPPCAFPVKQRAGGDSKGSTGRLPTFISKK
jgi:hypothetical protein